MPIACTRCGAKEEGELISGPIAFAFKHEAGCGHGVGPLAVIKGQIKKPKVEETTATTSTEDVVVEVEPTVEESKPKEKKRSRFSRKE